MSTRIRFLIRSWILFNVHNFIQCNEHWCTFCILIRTIPLWSRQSLKKIHSNIALKSGNNPKFMLQILCKNALYLSNIPNICTKNEPSSFLPKKNRKILPSFRSYSAFLFRQISLGRIRVVYIPYFVYLLSIHLCCISVVGVLTQFALFSITFF